MDIHVGREMCLMAPLCIVCFLVALMTSEQMTEDTKYAVNPMCALICLVVLQVVAIVYMERSCRKSSRRTLEVNDKGLFSAARGVRGKLEKMVKTFCGLWIFGGGGIVLDVIMFMYALLSLIDATTASGVCKAHLVFLTMFHFVKICFTIGQIHYLQYSLQNNIDPSRKAIYLIIGVNVLVWLSCFQQEAESLTEYYKKVHILEEGVPAVDIVGNYSYDCLPTNGSWYHAVHEWGKYLYPCTMEFSFVAIDLLYHVLVMSQEKVVELVHLKGDEHDEDEETRSLLVDDGSGRGRQHHGRAPPPTYASITDDRDGDIEELGENNEQAPLCRSVSSTSTYSDNDLPQPPSGLTKLRTCFNHFSTQGFKIGVAFLIVYAGLEFLVVYAPEIDHWLIYVQYALDCIFSLLVVRLSYLGASYCKENTADFQAEDVLRIVTAGSTWIINMYGVIGSLCMVVASDLPSSVAAPTPWLVVLVHGSTIVHVFCQTLFFVKASPRNFRSDLSEDEKASLGNCLKFLTFYNFVKWIIDTFCEFNSSVKLVPVQVTVFREDWLYVNLFILPAAIFYRFQMTTSFFKLIF